MSRVPKIDARMACRVVEDFRRRGLPVDDLLNEVGLRRADISDPEARIPYSLAIGLMERAATVMNDPSLGLRLGALQHASDSGLLGFVLLDSPDLLTALNGALATKARHSGGCWRISATTWPSDIWRIPTSASGRLLTCSGFQNRRPWCAPSGDGAACPPCSFATNRAEPLGFAAGLEERSTPVLAVRVRRHPHRTRGRPAAGATCTPTGLWPWRRHASAIACC